MRRSRVEPVRMMEVEVGEVISGQPIASRAFAGAYHRGLALVRLHAQLLGVIELEPSAGGAGGCAAQIWKALGSQINAHLREDGIAPVTDLPPAGLPSSRPPACLEARERCLAGAPFMSVVIPTRDRPVYLCRCLRALLSSEYPSTRYEIIVADNAPKSGASAALVRDLAQIFPQVSYVREDVSGSASARNRGLARARGEIVAFTDDDAIVDRHWLTEIARAFDAIPGAAAVIGLVLPAELETAAQVWFEQYGGFTRGGCTPRIFNLTDHRAKSPIFPYDISLFGAGNNMAFRRSALLQMGGFDPALGNGTPTRGGVDAEILLRTILHGHTLVYRPAALVRHSHRRAYADLRRQLVHYGIGMGACYTKTLLTRPGLLRDFISKLPHGLLYALSPRSPINDGKQEGYPKELTLLWLLGLLYGPMAYVRSARRYGSFRRSALAGDAASPPS